MKRIYNEHIAAELPMNLSHLNDHIRDHNVTTNKGGVLKKSIIVVVLLAFVASGCTGSFNLTKKVYNFHRSQGDKWTDELFFLGCVLLPIYGISTFADAIVFNSIEFWTGKNPVEMSKSAKNGQSEKIVMDGNNTATIRYNKDNQQVTIAAQTAAGENSVVTLAKADGMVKALDQNGKTLYYSTRAANGDLAVYDGNDKLVKNYSPSEIQQLKERMQ